MCGKVVCDKARAEEEEEAEAEAEAEAEEEGGGGGGRGRDTEPKTGTPHKDVNQKNATHGMKQDLLGRL